MGTMAVMAELHQMPNLKLNLKFEVEVLCNTLSLDLKVFELFVDFFQYKENALKFHNITKNEQKELMSIRKIDSFNVIHNEPFFKCYDIVMVCW